jgi:hypothetical protein
MNESYEVRPGTFEDFGELWEMIMRDHGFSCAYLSNDDEDHAVHAIPSGAKVFIQ